MIQKVVVVILMLASMMMLGLWLVSYWTDIRWHSKHPAELPNFSSVVYDGGWSVTRSRHFETEEQPVDKAMGIAGFAVIIQHHESESTAVLDLSPGLHIGQLKFVVDDKSVRHAGGLGFVAVPNHVSTHIIVPCWFLAVICASYPALAFIRGPVRRWRRRKRGLCVRCGYNLTGLTEPRCPECGSHL